MSEEKKTEEVKKTEDGGVAPSAAKTSEDAASTEVKTDQTSTEEKTEDKKPEDKGKDANAKMQEQIDNLNIALKQERDKPKADPVKVTELEKKLDESNIINEKLRSVFAPEEKTEETSTSDYMTKDEAEEFFKKKGEEQVAEKKEEDHKTVVKGQINDLEKSWDGVDGKPKYDDQKVLKWQEENNKLYLLPKEAFAEMEHDSVLDYEVKQRLAGKKPVENVEKPSGDGGEPATPEEKKPQTDQETRAAVLEAMENLEKEV